MTTPPLRATLARNLRSKITHDLGPGSRFSVRAWAQGKELDVRLITRMVSADNSVTLDKLEEVAAACGVKAWQLLLDDFEPGSPADAPITEEDRALLRRLRRMLGPDGTP